MLRKTHLAIGLAFGLYFLPLVTYKILFVPVVLIASLLPDIDSVNSKIGKKIVFRPIQAFMTHRGPLHSYTICVLVSLLFALFFPVIALPFFLGYSFHLFADSFTLNGIRPFWPLKFSTAGVVKVGGAADKVILIIFVVISIFLFLKLFA